MNLDHDFFHVSKLNEDQKKGLHQTFESFFPRIQVKTKKRSSPNFKSFFLRIQVIHMQTTVKSLEGIQSNYWGSIFPLSPRVSRACLLAISLYLASYLMMELNFQGTDFLTFNFC